jgi:hypothetical protein
MRTSQYRVQYALVLRQDGGDRAWIGLRQSVRCFAGPVTAAIDLDFDAEGRLIGIELLSGALLHPVLAAKAEKP